MNRKNIRTIIITALILLIAVTAILKLDIEPADQSENASVVSTSTEEVSQKNQPELEKPVEVQSTKDNVWIYTCDLGVDVGDNSTW